MGAALVQGSHFHFNFLLSGVDVCGKSHGETARGLLLFTGWGAHSDLVCACVSACVCVCFTLTASKPPSPIQRKDTSALCRKLKKKQLSFCYQISCLTAIWEEAACLNWMLIFVCLFVKMTQKYWNLNINNYSQAFWSSWTHIYQDCDSLKRCCNI